MMLRLLEIFLRKLSRNDSLSQAISRLLSLEILWPENQQFFETTMRPACTAAEYRLIYTRTELFKIPLK